MLSKELVELRVVRAELRGVVLGFAEVEVCRGQKNGDEEKSAYSFGDTAHCYYLCVSFLLI